ncbi:Pumilio 2, partial [Ascosphaera atra]
MLEHCKETDIVWILGEIRECAVELIRDTYGNYVIQHIIRRGSTENRRFMEDIIASRMIEFSKHKYASNVVECAIKHTDKEHLMSFVTPFSCSQDVLLSAMRDPYTNYVIQTLLETLKGPDRHDFVVSLKALFPKLKERKEIESINQKQITALEEHLNSPKYETGHSYSDDALASAFSDSMHLDDSKKHCSSVNDLKSLSYSEQVKRGPTANTPRRNRRNKSGKPIQPRSVSPDSFSEALGRSRRPRKGISSESSSVHDSSEPSYITDTTATTP